MKLTNIISAALFTILTACGGGGSDEQPTPIKETPQAISNPPTNGTVTVFLGDSITQGWDTAGAFPELKVINAGVSGNTTVQMLARFQASVLDHKPGILVIEGGWNDIATLPNPNADSLRSMVSLAKAAGIRVILLNMTPTKDKQVAVSAWNRDVALVSAQLGVEMVDMFSALADGNGNPLPGVLSDEVHPYVPGYVLMNAKLRKHFNL